MGVVGQVEPPPPLLGAPRWDWFWLIGGLKQKLRDTKSVQVFKWSKGDASTKVASRDICQGLTQPGPNTPSGGYGLQVNACNCNSGLSFFFFKLQPPRGLGVWVRGGGTFDPTGESGFGFWVVHRGPNVVICK